MPQHHIPEHDPHSPFEDEGIPDLEEGAPQHRWAVDPQEVPLPGDRPLALDDYGLTTGERLRGEPLERRLKRELPDRQPVYGADLDGDWPAQPEEPSGAVWEEPRRAGRLVAPDEGTGLDMEPREIAWEAGPDAGGYSPEEAAMRVDPEP